MTAQALVSEALRRGLVLTAAGDQLRYRGPGEAQDPAFIEKLRQHKAAVLGVLKGRRIVAETIAEIDARHGARAYDSLEFQAFESRLAVAFVADDVGAVRRACAKYTQTVNHRLEQQAQKSNSQQKEYS